jgi:hypothetical protein
MCSINATPAKHHSFGRAVILQAEICVPYSTGTGAIDAQISHGPIESLFQQVCKALFIFNAKTLDKTTSKYPNRLVQQGYIFELVWVTVYTQFVGA